MSQIKCSCGSTNCSLIPWNGKKEGAKNGGLMGALGGALIGLAGGPIGAIAGAALGAAGGAALGEDQPKDKSGRKIEKYKCNSCNKKFDVCPQCEKLLSYKEESSSNSGGKTTNKYCKSCNNFISSHVHKTQTQAQRESQGKALNSYIDSVKRNFDSFDD